MALAKQICAPSVYIRCGSFVLQPKVRTFGNDCSRSVFLNQVPLFPCRSLFFCSKTMNATENQPCNSTSNWIAAIQMTSGNDKKCNMQVCNSLIEQAVAQKNVKMVFLPEGFDFISSGREETTQLAESLNGSVIENYRSIASKFGVWLSLGGFHHRLENDTPQEVAKTANVHIIIDSKGDIVATYDKVHLFDVSLPEKNITLKESSTIVPGGKLVKPVQTPIGTVGLAICYDIRFPEFSEKLRREGAEILTYPSAFTVHTGAAHWETLLRSRAIENQCYVVAAAQIGRHNAKRESYGHSMIINPWGTVLAEACATDQVIFAEVDMNNLRRIRNEMPVASHKRYDIYENIEAQSRFAIPDDSLGEELFDFGQVKVKTKFSFLESQFARAFVNRKCILPGHVLVICKRKVTRLHLLSDEEVKDLCLLVQKVEIILEHIHGTTAANIASQDGLEAGQSISHVHFHVLPRRAGDFTRNDDIYEELEKLAKVKESEVSNGRSEEEMFEESSTIREVIRKNFSSLLK